MCGVKHNKKDRRLESAVSTTMQSQNITKQNRCQILRKCANFGCPNMAYGNWPCCESVCGYNYSRDRGYMENVQKGVTEWNDPFWGIHRWSIKKITYYYNLYNYYAKRTANRT